MRRWLRVHVAQPIMSSYPLPMSMLFPRGIDRNKFRLQTFLWHPINIAFILSELLLWPIFPCHISHNIKRDILRLMSDTVVRISAWKAGIHDIQKYIIRHTASKMRHRISALSLYTSLPLTPLLSLSIKFPPLYNNISQLDFNQYK